MRNVSGWVGNVSLEQGMSVGGNEGMREGEDEREGGGSFCHLGVMVGLLVGWDGMSDGGWGGGCREVR